MPADLRLTHTDAGVAPGTTPAIVFVPTPKRRAWRPLRGLGFDRNAGQLRAFLIADALYLLADFEVGHFRGRAVQRDLRLGVGGHDVRVSVGLHRHRLAVDLGDRAFALHFLGIGH